MRKTYNLPEVAKMLGISKSLIYKMAADGQIPGLIRLGEKRLVVPIAAVARILESADDE